MLNLEMKADRPFFILFPTPHQKQGDFLLIVLKDLLEKQSAHDTPKLKVILMYVDKLMCFSSL